MKYNFLILFALLLITINAFALTYDYNNYDITSFASSFTDCGGGGTCTVNYAGGELSFNCNSSDAYHCYQITKYPSNDWNLLGFTVRVKSNTANKDAWSQLGSTNKYIDAELWSTNKISFTNSETGINDTGVGWSPNTYYTFDLNYSVANNIYTGSYNGTNYTATLGSATDNNWTSFRVVSGGSASKIITYSSIILHFIKVQTVPPTSISVDFNYSVRKDLNQILLTDTSVATGVTKTAWTWVSNGSTVSTDQNYNLTATQLTDYNICLHVDTNQSDVNGTTCKQFNTGDWQAPTTTFSSFQVPNTTDQNITLTCNDTNGYGNILGQNTSSDTTYDLTYGTCTSSIMQKFTAIYPTNNYLKLKKGTASPTSDQNFTIQVCTLNSQTCGPITTCTCASSLASYTMSGEEWASYNADSNVIIPMSFSTTQGTKYGIFIDATSGTTGISSIGYSATTRFNGEYFVKYIGGFPGCMLDKYTNKSLFFEIGKQNSIGCDYFSYRINNGAWTTKKYTDANRNFLYSGTGINTIDYNSTDYNGNQETTKTSLFTTVGNLIPPTITLTTNQSYGFVTDFNIGVTINCQDDWLDSITYDINMNTDTNQSNVYHAVDVNNQNKTYYFTNSAPQQVKFKGRCTDGSGNYAEADTNLIYQLLFRLINEQTGAVITTTDLNSWLTSGLLYTYDGNYSFDFNNSGVTQKKFLSPSQEMRFDFVYKNSTVTIGRDIDFSLISDTNIPICLAPPQTFYIQTFYSASQKPTILYSESTRCYNMISNTKFALENGLMSRAYTIPKPYLLKTIIGGITTTLASIDGSLENTINIDSLQFNQSALDIKIGNDAISFGKDLSDYNIMKFYYLNPNNDSTSTTITIKNGSVVVFTYTDTNTPNEFVSNWNYTDYNIDKNAILTMLVNKTIEGVVESYTIYFTLSATYYSGSVNEWFALIVALCLVLFGMTLVAYKHSFGWFGLIMLIAAFLILALAPGYWYVRFFQGILLILIIFVGIVFKNETQGAV